LNASAKKTVKKLSRLAWLVAHVPLAVDHAEVAQPVVVSAAAALVGAPVAEVADKSQWMYSKNAASCKGNPLKRLK
jgi:hypothetical protein